MLCLSRSISVVLLIISMTTAYGQERSRSPGTLPSKKLLDNSKANQGTLPGHTTGPVSPLPASKAADVFDVIGIKLGMRFPEAVSILETHMQVRDRIILRPKETSKRTVFATGNIFVSSNGNEVISILHEPDINGDRVFAVGRFYFEDNGTFDAAQTISNLYDKYGTVLRTKYNGYFFQNAKDINENANTFACSLSLGSLGFNFGLYNENGSSIETANLLNKNLQSFGFRFDQLLWVSFKDEYLKDLEVFKKCLPTAIVWVPEVKGPIRALSIWIADVATYAAGLQIALQQSTKRPPKL